MLGRDCNGTRLGSSAYLEQGQMGVAIPSVDGRNPVQNQVKPLNDGVISNWCRISSESMARGYSSKLGYGLWPLVSTSIMNFGGPEF